MGEHFSAVVGEVGVNPCVAVPASVSAALSVSGYVPVRLTLNGYPFRAGLVSLGGGRHRLYINGQMRQTAGVDVGDAVDIELEYDSEPRRRAMPPQLAVALEADPEARAAWDALTQSRRNEVLDYLNSLKRAVSVDRNVDKFVRSLKRRR